MGASKRAPLESLRESWERLPESVDYGRAGKPDPPKRPIWDVDEIVGFQVHRGVPGAVGSVDADADEGRAHAGSWQTDLSLSLLKPRPKYVHVQRILASVVNDPVARRAEEREGLGSLGVPRAAAERNPVVELKYLPVL